MKAVVVIDQETIFRLPTFYEGEKGRVIYFYIKHDGGSILDLTDYTGKFKMKRVGEVTHKVDEDLIIDEATAGKCSYSFALADLADSGLFDVYIEFTNTGDTQIFVIPIGRLKIMEA